MKIGQRLVAANLVGEADIAQALERQRQVGGTLGENLVALGAVSAEAVQSLLSPPPAAPRRLEDIGLDQTFLVGLALKLMHARGVEQPTTLAREIKLPTALSRSLLEEARERGFVEVKAAQTIGLASEAVYVMTQRGRGWVTEMLRESQYVGPAPVPLDDYVAQTSRQRLTNDRVSQGILNDRLSGLELPAALIGRLGPAANSGKAILLYGAPGNGKTSVAEAIAHSFSQPVWVPHAIWVSGSIIRIFDPALHREMPPEATQGGRLGALRTAIDERWVRCRRPTIITGGELTMEMLDLSAAPGGFYLAPLQLKAQGGVFLIDDFGRQRVDPRQLLDRWIIPLERGYDFLSLGSGHKFMVPFDGLVLFSTNVPPDALMDAAQLRRIPYKYRIEAPSLDAYRRILDRVCRDEGLECDADTFDSLIRNFYQACGVPLAGFHPRFIVEHVIARCRFEGRPSRLTPELALEAAAQLLAGQ